MTMLMGHQQIEIKLEQEFVTSEGDQFIPKSSSVSKSQHSRMRKRGMNV